MRTNPAFPDAIEDNFHPHSHFLGLVPHVPEIQSEDSFVLIQQAKRMKPRRLPYGFQHSKFAFYSVCRGRRNAKHSQPACSSQGFITLSPVTASKRVDHQFDSTIVCKFLKFSKPILIAVIDRMVQSTLAKHIVFSG